MQRQAWLDALAGTASLACLMHCLMLPLLIALLPALSEVLALPESFHRFALMFAVPASTLALLAGYRRHRNPVAAAAGSAGLMIMGLAAFAAVTELQETLLTVIGATVVAAAHFANWRLSGAAR